MPDIGIEEWLGRLGFAQYAPAFLRNDITPAMLASLTADDLKELGISSIGHRRRLPEAAAAWERAGRRALLRSAQPEAESCFREALRQVAALPQTALRDRRELDPLLELSGPGHAVRGAAPDSEAVPCRARVLAERLGDFDTYRQAAIALGGYLVIAGRYADTVATVEAMRRILGDAADGPLRSHVGCVVGRGAVFLGDLATAERELTSCVERFRTPRSRSPSRRPSHPTTTPC